MEYTPAANLLSERVVLVTGAGDGIGRAVAHAAAAHGATVVLLGRTLRKLERVYDEIEAAGHPQPGIFPMNLEGAGPHEHEALATKIKETFGRLDGMVHNAAQLGTVTPIEAYDEETWYRVMQVNLNAPYMLTRHCIPLLRQSSDASVIFTSDAIGRHGRAYWGAYAVSKAGLEGLMQTLADELEKTVIRINSVDPGPTRTRLRATAYPAEDAGRLAQPDAVTPPFLYLLGPDSRGVNGRAF